MLKITIQMTNGTIVTFECSDSNQYLEIITGAHQYLTGQLLNRELDNSVSPEPISNSDLSDLNVPYDEEIDQEENHRQVSEFRRFCQWLDPLPDMRRVVVAAEGARRFFGTLQVSPVELTQLFEWLKWEQPPSFLQTLRNTSRSNYRWMQNVPGGSGYYVVTERGRQTVIQHECN